MKIAIFSDNFYPELSGIADSIISLARCLAKRGHEVLFCAPRYSRKNYRLVNRPPGEPALGERVRVRRFASLPYPGPTGQSRLVLPTGLRWLWLKGFKPDLIHTQLFFGVGLEALVAARRLKVPLVGTSHTPMAEFVKYSPVRSPRVEKLVERYVNWYYGKCDFVTAPSQPILDEMKAGGFTGVCRALSNPIELESFSPAGPEQKAVLKKKLGLGDQVIFYAGRLAEEKRLEVILRAIALVKERNPLVVFVIAGLGDGRGKLEALAAELNLKNNIRFFGFLPARELVELYRASDVFSVTSTAETQCLSMMNAMACGLPVIGVRARALPEFINSENGFLIEVDDHRALAEKINLLLGDQPLREKLGRGGTEFVKRFAADHIAEEWEKIYTETISAQRSKI